MTKAQMARRNPIPLNIIAMEFRISSNFMLFKPFLHIGLAEEVIEEGEEYGHREDDVPDHDGGALGLVARGAGPDLRELYQDHAQDADQLSREGSRGIVEVVAWVSCGGTFEDETGDFEYEVDVRPVVLEEEDGLAKEWLPAAAAKPAARCPSRSEPCSTSSPLLAHLLCPSLFYYYFLIKGFKGSSL
jgi:hypothetical protein